VLLIYPERWGCHRLKSRQTTESSLVGKERNGTEFYIQAESYCFLAWQNSPWKRLCWRQDRSLYMRAVWWARCDLATPAPAAEMAQRWIPFCQDKYLRWAQGKKILIKVLAGSQIYPHILAINVAKNQCCLSAAFRHEYSLCCCRMCPRG